MSWAFGLLECTPGHPSLGKTQQQESAAFWQTQTLCTELFNPAVSKLLLGLVGDFCKESAADIFENVCSPALIDQLSAAVLKWWCTYVLQKKSDMRHSEKVFRREVLRDQACRSASNVEGGTCPTFFVVRGLPSQLQSTGQILVAEMQHPSASNIQAVHVQPAWSLEPECSLAGIGPQQCSSSSCPPKPCCHQSNKVLAGVAWRMAVHESFRVLKASQL